MWDGRRYRCVGCGEIYCESLVTCPCCNAACIALDGVVEPEIVKELDSVAKSVVSSVDDILKGLTDDQRTVVEIDSGRHLVLAPPGTGKTEMLTRRVARALANGHEARRMFCGTFTIRAAVEMRNRISEETKLPRERLPEIGNLHHFCYSFLSRNHFVAADRQIVDEVSAREMVQDCLKQFRETYGVECKTTEGKCVLLMPGEAGVPTDKLSPAELNACKGYLDFKNADSQGGKPVLVELVTGMEGLRQRSAGIPERLCEPMPITEPRRAFIADILKRYSLMKERLSVIDFDDLIIEAYSRLSAGTLPDELKYDWIQVDEVQDLNPLQWAIVGLIATADAVLVYFGDYDQSIFSFMGASLSVLDEKARTCVVHSFKKNFRATSYLLDLLTRYSFKVLESRFPFVPSPHVYQNADGALVFGTYDYDVIYSLTSSDRQYVDRKGTQDCKRNQMMNMTVGQVYELLQDCISGRVAVLVQTNRDADAIADRLMQQGVTGVVRFSGEEFSHVAAYRNAAALFETISNPTSRLAWARLFFLFGGSSEVPTLKRARELAMSVFEVGLKPTTLLQRVVSASTVEQQNWLAEHQGFVNVFARKFAPYRSEFLKRIGGHSSIREEMTRFRDFVDSTHGSQEPTPLDRLEHFFRWTDENYATDKRAFVDIVAHDWLDLSRMKEADMLTDGDRVVVSTVHKAKGLQFEAVIIPDVDEYPSYFASKTRAGREESARLLYVALSRARRRLVLLRGQGVDKNGCPDPTLLAHADYIEPIAESFAHAFADFYYRRDCLGQLLEQIRMTDWMADQYLVAEAVRLHQPLSTVDAFITHKVPSVRRMAVLALEWEEDSARREELLTQVLLGSDAKASLNAVMVIRNLRILGLLKPLRSLMTRLRISDRALKLEILSAYEAMTNAPKVNDLIGDFIYDADGGIRREAARLLFDRGVVCWKDVVRGDGDDWICLKGINDQSHDAMLSWMVDHGSPFVCNELRNLVLQRRNEAYL